MKKISFDQFAKEYKPDNKILRALADFDEPAVIDEYGDTLTDDDYDYYTCDIITYALGVSDGVMIWTQGDIHGLDITVEGDDIEEVYTELQAALYEATQPDTAAYDAWICSR